ncbi:MAG: hypothetical protein ACR2GZ_02220 [Solirubrobacteraceae bacterium]
MGAAAILPQPYFIGYRDFGQGGARPYLVMRVTGINGKTGIVWGLVDSGADRTSMPFGFASLMGYTPADLTLELGTGAGGAITMYVSHKQSTAVVPEIPAVSVAFEPIFIQGGKTVLWGRHDFMRKFDVGIMESTQRFSITPVP